jgi:uncharacterized protein (DUF2252 family)
MPLTKKGRKILTMFKRKYSLKRGKNIFYAHMNKYPKRTAKWHRKS